MGVSQPRGDQGDIKRMGNILAILTIWIQITFMLALKENNIRPNKIAIYVSEKPNFYCMTLFTER